MLGFSRGTFYTGADAKGAFCIGTALAETTFFLAVAVCCAFAVYGLRLSSSIAETSTVLAATAKYCPSSSLDTSSS